MAHELGVTQAEAYEHLMQLSPFEDTAASD